MNRIYLVDAFAGRGALGNPAGVCPLDTPAEEAWMRRVALEMNQAETAFTWSADGQRHIRWFTPAVEVDLCGHATLATVHILSSEGWVKPGETVTFQSASGPLICRAMEDGIELDFPSVETTEQAMPEVLRGLLAEAVWFGGNRMDLFCELPDERSVREFKPDLTAIREAGGRGLIITARGAEADFVSRFFGPAAGIDEDPVTGSAHCALAPYWAAKLGKAELTAYQASPRGGWVNVRLEGGRCHLQGQAVTTLRGEILV